MHSPRPHSTMTTTLPPHSTSLSHPLSLVRNATGLAPPPGLAGSFDGLAAAPGFSSTSVFTTPNQCWVPKFAVARQEITTYQDGRWGHHEYSRWPQAYDSPHIHVACIPRPKAPGAPTADVVWRTWERADWQTEACGVPRFGKLARSLLRELDAAAETSIALAERTCDCNPSIKRIRHFLTICLRHCVDRLRLLPAERSVIVALAAHAQRLILEFAGLHVYVTSVLPRLESQGDFRTDILDVVGAWTHDAGVVQMLHRAGVPVWFQQQLTRDVVVWSVVSNEELPVSLSRQPSYPRLVLAARDLSGFLNTPGEWQRAMDAVVRRQLCGSRLPDLSQEESIHALPAAKRVRGETLASAESSDGDAGRSIPCDARRLGHKSSASSARARAARGCPAKASKHGAASKPRLAAGSSRMSFHMNPFRQHYASAIVKHAPVWSHALAEVSPLPQPRSSVAYYFPPPWLFDSLNGYPLRGEDKITRYVHHFASIRTFCRIRLFDRSVAGRPLTISEWRDALWGDYSLDDPAESRGLDSTVVPARHRLKQNLRQLFGKLASLPSYDPASTPQVGGMVVSLDAASSDQNIRRRLVWEAHETNWRCELLALDAAMVGSNDWPEIQRWTRESHVSEVWGSSRSGLALCPDVDQDPAPFCWYAAPVAGWEDCLTHLRAFVDLLVRWPGCPAALQHASREFDACDAEMYTRVQEDAVRYYVRTFVDRFDRLPTPPVLEPLSQMTRSPELPAPIGRRC